LRKKKHPEKRGIRMLSKPGASRCAHSCCNRRGRTGEKDRQTQGEASEERGSCLKRGERKEGRDRVGLAGVVTVYSFASGGPPRKKRRRILRGKRERNVGKSDHAIEKKCDQSPRSDRNTPPQTQTKKPNPPPKNKKQTKNTPPTPPTTKTKKSQQTPPPGNTLPKTTDPNPPPPKHTTKKHTTAKRNTQKTPNQPPKKRNPTPTLPSTVPPTGVFFFGKNQGP